MAKVHRAFRHSWWRRSKEITTDDCQAMRILASVEHVETYISLDVIAEHFGCSVDFVREQVLHRAYLWGEQTEASLIQYKWRLEEIRHTLDYIDKLFETGELNKKRREFSYDDRWRYNPKIGKGYFASYEQMMEEMALQENSSLDADGNLVIAGKIAKKEWL
jgi:hypothetical protein